jgi:hypothetical protein
MRMMKTIVSSGLATAVALSACLLFAGCKAGQSGGVTSAEKNAPPPAGGTNAGKMGGTGTAPPAPTKAPGATKAPAAPGK